MKPLIKRRGKRNQPRLPLGTALTRRWHQLTRALKARSVYEYNERIIYGEMVFQAVAGAGAMSFIAVYLVRLGAPNLLVGLYTSLPALITMLVVIPIGAYVQRQRNLIKFLNWSRFLFRAGVGLFALLAWLPATLASYILLVIQCLMSIPGSAINISVVTIWGKATTPERRPRMLSTRMAVHGTFAAGVGFLAGQWLDWAPFPLNYQLLFLSALLAGLGSIYMMSRLRIPEVQEDEIPRKKRVDLREMALLIRETESFRNFAIAAFIFRMGMSAPSALYSIYRVRELGASDAWIGILLTVERIVSVFAYFALGRLLNNKGFRSKLWLTCLGISLYPFLTALSKTPEALLLPSAVIGIFGAGMNIFLTDTLFLVSPESQRPTFIAANSFLANVTAFVAPLLGTALADATTISTALIIIACVRFVGGLSFWRLGVGSEPKNREAESVPA